MKFCNDSRSGIGKTIPFSKSVEGGWDNPRWRTKWDEIENREGNFSSDKNRQGEDGGLL